MPSFTNIWAAKRRGITEARERSLYGSRTIHRMYEIPTRRTRAEALGRSSDLADVNGINQLLRIAFIIPPGTIGCGECSLVDKAIDITAHNSTRTDGLEAMWT